MSIEFSRDHAALVLVDVQPDFMPGGALATADGHDIVEPLQRLLAAERFAVHAATQDWHPPDHISFASQHDGRAPMETIELYGETQVLWPDHCVQGSHVSRLHPEFDWDCVNVIVRKGTDPRVDSYSGFRDNLGPDGHRPPTGLGGYLHERSVRNVFVCGLARDVCVKWTAEDAADAGFATWMLWDVTRPVTYDSDDETRRDLERSGVRIVSLEDLLG